MCFTKITLTLFMNKIDTNEQNLAGDLNEIPSP